ncbi:MAG: hypothetical protein GY790_17185 [Bacteroidetes bacterium]|nr:hypothetical protein [Bacteroidota bacterium]
MTQVINDPNIAPKLSQNVPNPFSEITIIGYSIPEFESKAIRYTPYPDNAGVIFRNTYPQIKSPGGLWDTSEYLHPAGWTTKKIPPLERRYFLR